jgi:branched-chain amino acid transport system ATP-binding protein
MRTLTHSDGSGPGASDGASDGAALRVTGLSAGYGGVDVVRDVSFTVGAGEIVGLLGRNGAGKTTTIMAIGGYLGPRSRKAGAGTVTVGGTALTGPPYRRAGHSRRAHSRPALGLVLEGRSVFGTLTVRQNLGLAGAPLAQALDLFPELSPKLALKAGLLSGGEQQMLALARAVGRRPRVLLIDELSFGLAPAVCERIFSRLRCVVAGTGAGVLLVEQHIHYAAQVTDRALIMNEGAVRAEVPGAELTGRSAEIERLYLGESF